VLHLNCLHGAGISSGSGVDFKELLSGRLHSHDWRATWEPQPEPDSHIANMKITMKNFFMGWHVNLLDSHLTVNQVGDLLPHNSMDCLHEFLKAISIKCNPLLQRLGKNLKKLGRDNITVTGISVA